MKANIFIEDVSRPYVYFDPATYRVTEDAGSVELVVRLSDAVAGTVTVDYQTLDLTAKCGLDYAERSGWLVFEPGSRQTTIKVDILPDLLLEPDEQFQVELFNAVGANIGLPDLPMATYYVAPGGEDRAPGTLSDPWATLQKAMATVAPGDVVHLRGGEYRVAVSDPPVRTQVSGTLELPIVFRAHPGEVPVLCGGYPTIGDANWDGVQVRGHGHWVFDGLTVQGFHSGMRVFGPSHHVVCRNCELKFNSEAGFNSVGSMAANAAQGGDYLLVEDNVICWNGFRDDGSPAVRQYEGFGSGVTLNARGVPYWHDQHGGFHSVIMRNTIYHNYDGTGGDLDADDDHTDGNGIIVDLGGNFPPLLIENNLVFDNGGRGIHPHASSNIWIVGNTLYQNNWDSKMLNAPQTQCEIGGYPKGALVVDNVHVINNIVCGRPGAQLTFFPEVLNLDVRNNCFFGTPYREAHSPYGTGCVQADPLFMRASVDPLLADFRLQAGSPCRDAGAVPPEGAQRDDHTGMPRPQGTGYDMGAWETRSDD